MSMRKNKMIYWVWALCFFIDVHNITVASNSQNAHEFNYASQPYSKIIAAEGMPGAGKTSLLSVLAKELEGNFILLSELNFEPNSPWKKFSIKKQGKIFHQLWVERIALLKQFKESPPYFLLDRTYLSTLAYTYALDSLKGTSSYVFHKESFKKDFSKTDFGLLFVFDITPEIGLKRRLKRGDIIPWPWSEIKFLRKIRQFYKEELPNYTNAKIIYIDTSKLNENEVKDLVKNEIFFFLSIRNYEHLSSKAANKKEIEILLEFAKDYNLGSPVTPVVYVFGSPTLYFLKQSVQLVNGRPIFFNNNRLRSLAKSRV